MLNLIQKNENISKSLMLKKIIFFDSLKLNAKKQKIALLMSKVEMASEHLKKKDLVVNSGQKLNNH
jgi:hypothetical protein